MGPMMCKGFRFGGARGYEVPEGERTGIRKGDPAAIMISVLRAGRTGRSGHVEHTGRRTGIHRTSTVRCDVER